MTYINLKIESHDKQNTKLEGLSTIAKTPQRISEFQHEEKSIISLILESLLMLLVLFSIITVMSYVNFKVLQ